MSEPRRISPLSPSPVRASLSRANWPWSPNHRSSPLSAPSISTPVSQSSWESRSSISSGTSVMAPSNSTSTARASHNSSVFATNSIHEETTRQWTFTAFEWLVRDVHKLRDYVEGDDPVDNSTGNRVASKHDDFEILKESPMLGDGKFKLEIARMPVNETGDGPSKAQLSLYITSLALDFAPDFEMSASMMSAIKCQADMVGERGARPEWVWEFWHDWVFRHESEVWECPLPSLSVLLENPRIRDTDSFAICVQIHCPVGPFFPQQPSAFYVPRDLLDGLEASLDNPNTGDVRFVCLERLNPTRASPNRSASATPISRRSSSASSSHSAFPSETTARKRIIYAHSDILTRRSEYFTTMLNSEFSEAISSGPVSGERKLYTIVVEEADYEVIYWLLKWCYANWLLFKEHDDPRAAVDGVGAGWSARWLNVRGGEWDWKTFHKVNASEESNAGDTRSVTSAESLASNVEGGGSTTGKAKSYQPPATPTSSTIPPSPSRVTSSTKASTSSPSTSRQVPSSSTRRTMQHTTNTGSSNISVSMPSPSTSLPSGKTVSVPLSASNPKYPSSPHFPISPRSRQSAPSPDPHPHPAPQPAPASAFSIYQIAHRYAMPGLAALALDHIMTSITPQSSFALLLATSVWDDLRSLVEDYVVEKWDEVSVSEEFEQCCQEVAAGEWGPDGGKTLMALFRRLRSPTAMPFSRS